MAVGDRLGPRHFIYPLNPDGPYDFEDDDGTEYPTNYQSFLKLLDSEGRHLWGLSTNYLRVEDRDFIWAYFTQPDGAIRAVGRSRGDPFWVPDWGRYGIRIEWDRRLTSRLGRRPIKYTTFEQRISAAVTEANVGTMAVLESWLGGRHQTALPGADEEVQFTTRRIKARRGQRKFRDALMEAYGSMCVVTGCAEPDALEAAHILSVRRQGRHSVKNGLLLRADVHTLFDRGLIVIDNDYTVRVHLQVEDLTYRQLDGRRLGELASNPNRPTKSSLREHRKIRGWE